MSKQKEVAQLIRSLSIPEKKYFKQYVVRYREGANRHCILLFDIINKKKADDETAYHVLPPATARNLPVYLNQLNELLLDSLQAFHGGKSIDEQIRDLLNKADLLNGRSLSDAAEKLLGKARKLALKFEKHRLLLEVINLQRKVYETQLFRTVTEEDLARLQQEEKNILEYLQVENALIASNNELLFLFRTRGAVRDDKELEQYKRIAASMKILPEKLTSFRLKLLHRAFFINYYRGIQDYERAYEAQNTHNLFFRDYPHMIREYPRSYINSFTGRLSICLSLKKYTELYSVIVQLEQALTEHERWLGGDLLFFAQMNILLHRFVALLHSGKFDEVRALLPHVEQLFQHKEKMSPFFQLQFYFLTSAFYFSTGRYGEALKGLLNIRDDIKTHLFQQMFSMSRILMLIIYYEKHDTDLLYYEVKSVYRYLNRIQRFYMFEKILLDFIRLKIRLIRTGQDELAAFRELHGELIKIAEIPYEQGFIYHFDIISWLESKIENRPLEKILREKTMLLS